MLLLPSVSQSVSAADCRGMQVDSWGGSAGCNQPDQGLHNLTHLLLLLLSEEEQEEEEGGCLGVWTLPSSALQRQRELLHDYSVTRPPCFYLGLVGDAAPCPVDAKHKPLIFVFSFRVALLFHTSQGPRASPSAVSATSHLTLPLLLAPTFSVSK